MSATTCPSPSRLTADSFNAWIAAAGLTLNQAAILLGVTRSAVRRWRKTGCLSPAAAERVLSMERRPYEADTVEDPSMWFQFDLPFAIRHTVDGWVGGESAADAYHWHCGVDCRGVNVYSDTHPVGTHILGDGAIFVMRPKLASRVGIDLRVDGLGRKVWISSKPRAFVECCLEGLSHELLGIILSSRDDLPRQEALEHAALHGEAVRACVAEAYAWYDRVGHQQM